MRLRVNAHPERQNKKRHQEILKFDGHEIPPR
jgi:hypothetical protein